MPNISRNLEGMHSTNKRHFVATSHSKIQQYLDRKDFNGLLKFVLETTLNILRDKLRQIPKLKQLATRVDDLAMIELCVHYSVIQYADFI
jgi:hypothetical protein